MARSIFNFKELRRRSLASFRTDQSTDTSSNEDPQSQDTTPTTGSITPPSIATQSDPALNTQVKDQPEMQPARTRPPLQPYPNGNRDSVVGSMSPPLDGRSMPPLSKWAPRIHNLNWNGKYHQKAFLVHGTIGEAPERQLVDGLVTVIREDDTFPPIQWPVRESHFKALVYLTPGINRLRFEFSSPKMSNGGPSPHFNVIQVHMTPSNSAPMHLAILVAKDSPEIFDAVPARAEKEGNSLETATRKFRMAAYLWQAFVAEQMLRSNFGSRTFTFEEEWTTGTCSRRDREMGNMRFEARVEVIRTDRTVAELRQLGKASHDCCEDGEIKSELFDVVADAVRGRFQPLPGQKRYVSVLVFDSHWDPLSKVVTGHEALGGRAGDDLQLAVFGSHCLHSYPVDFDDVGPTFTDCRPTDTNHVANYHGKAGSTWEAASLGIGAHLHQVGHLLGCPRQESGIMSGDYHRFSRSFVPREAYSASEKAKGKPIVQEDECTWHRLDCLRFRSHPCFRRPNEHGPESRVEASVQAWASDENNQVNVVAPSGVSWVEVYTEGDDVCHTWWDYTTEGHRRVRLSLTEAEIRTRLPENQRRGKLRVSMKSQGGGSLNIDDFRAFSKASVKLGSGKTGYRGNKLGISHVEGSESQEIVFNNITQSNRILSRVAVYHGDAVHGLEFFYEDLSTQLFGTRGEKPGSVFDLDVRQAEYVNGFIVRSGHWIDAIQIVTSQRTSPVYGNVHGGTP